MARATTPRPAQPVKAKSPALEHPTGVCSEPGCEGRLKHTRSVAAVNEQNPGQEEYKCDTCGLLHIVSHRRWDKSGEVIQSPETED